MSCHRASNNNYFDCPARMSDGRIYADLRSGTHREYQHQKSIGINSSFQYRMYLQQNAGKFIEENRHNSAKEGWCGPCSDDLPDIHGNNTEGKTNWPIEYNFDASKDSNQCNFTNKRKREE